MKKIWLLLMVALFAVVLAACGSNGDQETEEDMDNNESAEETENGDASEDTRSVTIEDATGEKTIEGTPEKVVVLEWTYAEYLQPLIWSRPVSQVKKASVSGWIPVSSWVKTWKMSVPVRNRTSKRFPVLIRI
ncbi:hypothetical protein U0355_08615 [Salimicrobium sp. PL1-032A]|uniref:hypothetical protein n=1 Tax=Salimicrobium sp. PL1-032A TaxID=3095364 RepID=UPI0032614A55